LLQVILLRFGLKSSLHIRNKDRDTYRIKILRGDGDGDMPLLIGLIEGDMPNEYKYKYKYKYKLGIPGFVKHI
jgi:hypothetical protein